MKTSLGPGHEDVRFGRAALTACFVFVPLALLLFTSLAFATLASLLGLDPSSPVAPLVSLSLPMLLSLAIAPAALSVLKEKRSLENIGVYPGKKRGLQAALSALLIGAGSAITASQTGLSESSACLALHFVIAALSEEALARGVLFDRIEADFGPVVGLAVTSIVFAFVFHSNEGFLANALIRLPLGVGLGAARVASGGIWIPTGLHFLYNSIITTYFP